MLLVVGSEGKGLSRLVTETCDAVVSIPISSATESLNAGIAVSVALYEISRLRASAPGKVNLRPLRASRLRRSELTTGSAIVSVVGVDHGASSRRWRSTSSMYELSASARGTSRPSFLRHVPAVVEQLVEDLGRLELAAQVLRDGADDRLEDAAPATRGPPSPRRRPSCRSVARVGVEVVEQAPGLVLAGVEPGEPQQPARVVAGIDDLGLDAHLGARVIGLDREFLDVEAEVVQAFDALVDAPALGLVELLAAR